MTDGLHVITLDQLERCFSGAIPAVLCTASADGVPNVMYLSRAHRVDPDRIALSNQFMSKTGRNLAVNPRASLLLVDPATLDEYRLSLVFERTERRGHVFERLRADIDALAELEHMRDVFRLRAADIFRVVEIEQVPPGGAEPHTMLTPAVREPSPELTGLAEFAACIGRAADLDVLADVALEGLDRLLGYRHTMLFLAAEDGRSLYSIAGRGFDTDTVGVEVRMGDGQIGVTAERCEPMRIGGLTQLDRYTRSVRSQVAPAPPSREVPLPGLADAESRVAVPAMAFGQLVGVLVAESTTKAAFGRVDEHVLGIAATLVATGVEHLRAEAAADEAPSTLVSRPTGPRAAQAAHGDAVNVRYFAVDGSVFLDGDYGIKGVAGRILWTLLQQHRDQGRTEFTNKELRLDPSLEMPGFKDNLESRLILLKRRLDERGAPVRIEKSGRGRFRIAVTAPLRLEQGGTS